MRKRRIITLHVFLVDENKERQSFGVETDFGKDAGVEESMGALLAIANDAVKTAQIIADKAGIPKSVFNAFFAQAAQIQVNGEKQ